MISAAARPSLSPTPQDREVVRGQLGRYPRGEWRIGQRCRYGHPQTIVTAPVLADGAPFPTVLWLTCPFLVEAANALESQGEVANWAARMSEDRGLAARLLAADERYRELRAAEAQPHPDPCASTGIAGQSDPLATKCLHAHVAAFLGGLDDPIGESVVVQSGSACDDARCDALTCLREEPR